MRGRLASLLRSGWWVVPSALGACLVVVLSLPITRASLDRHGSWHEVSSYGFDLSACTVPPDRLTASGMPTDGLEALVTPDVLAADEVEHRNREGRGKLLVPTDRVIGIALGSEARAYPLRLLRWHEVVNDVVGDRSVAVTYNPLCDAVVVFDRRVGGEVLDFGVSGLLLNSNLLLYDRSGQGSHASLWSQLLTRAISGPHAGRRLAVLASSVTTWDQWRRRHPDTTVMAPSPDHARLYKRDPYHSYFGSDLLRFPVDPLPPAGDLALKDRVLAITVDGERAVFALPHLAAAAGRPVGSLDVTVGRTGLRIHFDLEHETADAEVLEPSAGTVDTRFACWFAWYAAHPDTELARPG
jgi:hypothetical protein